MQIFNVDETGVTIVNRPNNVVAELGRHKVYTITSAERGKTHTVLSCVSAAALALPPFIIYPRKRKVPDNFREGAAPGTLFHNTESGLMTKEVYLEWFKFFLDHIPPARPVVLIQDGHASHFSIELIELARANDIWLLCLPAHTSHILQPLDVGIFKPFKASFSKACSLYLAKCPGRVITTNMIASLVGSAWANSHTPVNIMGGFRKSEIYPLNPGSIDDRDLAPSKAFKCPKTIGSENNYDSATQKQPIAEERETLGNLTNKLTDLQINDMESSHGSNHSFLFTAEQERLYECRFKEGYDLKDPSYEAWLRINHPAETSSDCCHKSSSGSHVTSSVERRTNSESSASVLSEVLVLPKPKPAKKRNHKEGLNKRAVCITDIEVLEKLKVQEEVKIAEKKAKEARIFERQRKKEEREMKKKEKEMKKKERQMEKKGKEKVKKKMVKLNKTKLKKTEAKSKSSTSKQAKGESNVEREESPIDSDDAHEESPEGDIDNHEESPIDSEGVEESSVNSKGEDDYQQNGPIHSESESDSNDSAICPRCGSVYPNGKVLVCCDSCDAWYDLKCTGYAKKKDLPDVFHCFKCSNT